MKKLTVYLKELGFVKAELVKGPNGAFISATKPDGSKSTMPVGKKSQNGTIGEFNVLIADGGQAIATVNHYEAIESVDL